MQKTLLTYVKPHVQEDPLSMILGIGYLGASLEKEGLPVELCDERVLNDQEMRAAIERNDVIGFGALTRLGSMASIAKAKRRSTNDLGSEGFACCRRGTSRLTPPGQRLVTN